MNFISKAMSLYLVRYFTLFISLFILNGCVSLISHGKDNMVLIPEGVFTMGYKINNKNEWGDTDEEPVHKVFLKSYYIDRYEVTNQRYKIYIDDLNAVAPKYWGNNEFIASSIWFY